jgi:transcriptional regulator with XRE-family HTH domain
MDNYTDLPLGQRIAVHRRLRGLTQEALAQRLHRSASWVTKIERGERRVDSMSALLELARVLGVPLHQLTGHPDHTRLSTVDPPAGELNDLNRILDRSGSIGRTIGVEAPRALNELHHEAAILRRLYNTSNRKFSAVAPLLSGLIEEAQRAVAVASSAEWPIANAALSALYRLASLELRQRGDFARARLAVDRALMAAEQSEDGLLVASVAATLTVQLMMQGDPEDGVGLALDAAEHVRRQPRADSQAGLVIAGALHLYAAQAAARAKDRVQADQLLKVATDIGGELARDREEYFLIFGPTNVAIQTSGILVDLDNPAEAIRIAQAVRPERLHSVNRIGHHYLHIARAHGMRGNDDAAAAALVMAHRAAPELVRHDPLSRDLVRDMVRRKRWIGEQLRWLARDMRILDPSHGDRLPGAHRQEQR